MTTDPALPGLHYFAPSRVRPLPDRPTRTLEADVVVYGATSGGVAAATRAARAGRSVVLLAFDDHLGGMSASGLGLTDTGHPDSVGGLAREFYQRVAATYGIPFPHWDFEPSVAEETFEKLVVEAGVRLERRQALVDVELDDGRIASVRTDDGSVMRGRVFVDATYEGDLMAAAGVSFTTGRESSAVYGESLAGVQPASNHQFQRPVDPYVVPGVPASGLLPGVASEPHGATGSGDAGIQAYNFRLAVTTSPKRLPFPRPEGYDADRYELLRRHIDAGIYELYGRTCLVHGDVYDMNNHGAVSSDHIGANYGWPTGDYSERERIFQDHVRYQAGLLYFLANDPRLPERVRAATREYGLAPSAFAATSHWPHQLYVREGRRMVGDYVLTEHDGLAKVAAADPVALASYVMDSHNVKRVVVDGLARNEGNVQVPVRRPFGVSYRSLVPRRGECANLFVVAAVSASHVAFSSVRMEPVFMMLGEAVGVAADHALRAGVAVQDVEYEPLRRSLVAGGAVLDWPPREEA